MEYILYSIAGFMLGALIVSVIALILRQKLMTQNAELKAQIKAEKTALETASVALDHRFKATAQEALNQSSEQFLQLAQEKLKASQSDSAHDLEKRQKAISDLIDPVTKALSAMDEKLHGLEKARVTAYTELQTNLHSMAQDQLKLRQETATLVQALRSPSTRGQWGEMQLRRCLEMAGMQKGVHFEEQVSVKDNQGGTQRPDVIIKLSGGQSIVIDAKAPLDGFLDALKDGVTEEERDIALTRHARHVKEHIRSLGSKSYWEQFDTPEFVVMFLPGESYFSAALEQDPALIEAGVDQRVIPATPTTLISLLKAVMYGWKQEQLADNAREISALGSELYERISIFSGHMQRVGKGLDTAMQSYNKAVSSLENRVFVTARKFEQLHAAPGGKDIATPEQIDHTARALSAPEIEDELEDRPEAAE